jgi:hypothetical protein
MGLDMYLDAEIYTSRYSAPSLAQDLDAIVLRHCGLARDPEDARMLQATLSVRVGYWRKANAIHAWFVDQIQGGKDECQRTRVPHDKLAWLGAIANDALVAFKAEKWDRVLELLPPRGGFFFGSVDLDEWFERDLERTIKIVSEALAARERLISGPEGGRVEMEFYYRASW